MPLRRVDIVLAGYGRVGRALAALVLERGAWVGDRYGLDLRLRRVITGRGILDLPQGQAYAAGLRDLVEGGAAAPRGERPGPPPGGGTGPARGGAGFPAPEVVGVPREVLASAVAGDVLVDATPTDLASGQPGLAYLRAALGAGMHGVALSKGPLVVDWTGLQRLAARKGTRLMVSGATAAALPAGDTLVYSLTGSEVLSIEGVLNGTTNYILNRMEQGLTYREALAEAQARGIAEPEPRLDVEGWDTAAKMVILANLAWATPAPPGSGAASGAGSPGRAATLGDARVTGITSLTPEQLAQSRRQGRVLKLVGRALPPEGGRAPRVEVGPVDLPEDHPLARLAGANKGVTFVTDLMGSVTVTGGESSPRAAAAAALKDIIHLYI
ncbi:MAG: homoserine dehydrogenase [Bacillota bacterium]|nr:homoserine dehydrogenase [Bacillota bacterium]